MNSEKRPNASYNLSKPDSIGDKKIDESNLNFYYNRDRRLEKAPQSVRDLYTVEKRRRFGILHSLVSTKPKAILFISILILCVGILLLSITGYFDRGFMLDGNMIMVRGIKYDGTVILAVKKSFKEKNIKNVYSGAVDVAISPAATKGTATKSNEEYPVFYQRLFFTLEGQEEYRFVVPFEASELALVFQTEKSTRNMIVKPE